MLWFADPAGAGEISELRCAGFQMRRGDNAVRPGIMAVTARVESGMLRIVAGSCPHLLTEAGQYRYSDDPADRQSETPEDAYNHALGALRYLVAKLDARRLAKPLPTPPAPGQQPAPATPPPITGHPSCNWKDPWVWRIL